jgi:hypothetical protein
MHAIILVHGIMGSKLKLDTEEIWPPSVGEVLSGHYGRVAKLMDVHSDSDGYLVPIYEFLLGLWTRHKRHQRHS